MSERGAYRDTVDVIQGNFTKIISTIDNIQMSKSGVRLTEMADIGEETKIQQTQNLKDGITELKFNQTSNNEVLLKGQALDIRDLSSDIE